MIKIMTIMLFSGCFLTAHVAASGINLLGDGDDLTVMDRWSNRELKAELSPKQRGKFNNVRQYILKGTWIEEPQKIPLLILDTMRTHLRIPVFKARGQENTFNNQLDVAAKAIYALGSWIRLWDLYYAYGHCAKDGGKRAARGKDISTFSKNVRRLWGKVLTNLDRHPDRNRPSRSITEENLIHQLSQLSQYYRAPLTDVDEAIRPAPYRHMPGYNPEHLNPNLLMGIFYLGLYNHSWVWENPKAKTGAKKNPRFLVKGTQAIFFALEKRHDPFLPIIPPVGQGDLPTLPVLPLRNSFEWLSEWRPKDDS